MAETSSYRLVETAVSLPLVLRGTAGSTSSAVLALPLAVAYFPADRGHGILPISLAMGFDSDSDSGQPLQPAWQLQFCMKAYLHLNRQPARPATELVCSTIIFTTTFEQQLAALKRQCGGSASSIISWYTLIVSCLQTVVVSFSRSRRPVLYFSATLRRR